MSKYRPNVALILMNQEGEILIGERLDASDCWQFPQGGVKSHETLREALAREVNEELSLPENCYEVLEQRGTYQYLYPPGKVKEGYAGQEQTYFRALLKADFLLEAGPILSPEFQTVRWISPEDFQLDWVVKFKQKVYQQVFFDFWGIKIE